MAKAKTRNGNGEGTIYFDKSRNRYRGEIQFHNSKGERERKKFSGKTKREVKLQMDKFSEEILISQGKFYEADLYFEKYAEIWLQKQVNALKPTSYQRKEGILNNQVIPYLGHLTMNTIKKIDIEQMIFGLIKQDLSYSTVKKAFEVARSCITEYCNEDDITRKNPCEGMNFSKYMKKPPSDVVFFTPEEVKLIVTEAVKTYKNGAPVYRFGWAIVILAYTGLRIGELLALTWDDVDFDEKYIDVNKNAVNVKVRDKNGREHYQMVNQPGSKTDSGVRIVPLPEIAVNAFTELRKITGEETYVMSTRNGTQATQANVGRMFHKIINACGLKDELKKNHCIHALRHTYATMIFTTGGNSKIASELLGHADTRITENTYIHLVERLKKKTVEDINKYFT